MSSTIGWAVLSSSGRILIRTVSDTRRSAIVNFLVAECKQPVFAAHSDEDIEYMWAHFGKYAETRRVDIILTALTPAVPHPTDNIEPSAL